VSANMCMDRTRFVEAAQSEVEVLTEGTTTFLVSNEEAAAVMQKWARGGAKADVFPISTVGRTLKYIAIPNSLLCGPVECSTFGCGGTVP